ncbi:hypothetical protein [Haladaptatus caseinilyticus]|uniref:hypothetical protein n=1 Tax=Haladaptatus caseinilyticus TaxID=2993314 RepID=UPI00224ADAAA|nr:hypothetical protein [Haladaptatus caseinilyticus]
MSNQNGTPLDETSSHQTSRRRLLKAGAGIALTALAVPTLSSTAIAHFPENLDIDVKPDNDSNEIDRSSRGVVPVAVLQTDEFDPTSEAIRYRFGSPAAVESGGGACPVHEEAVEDIDGDGNDDLMLHFAVQDAGFESGETEAELRWERDESGEHGLSGRDSVRIVGDNEKHENKDDSMKTDEHKHGNDHQHGGEHQSEDEC